jgi:hypothetical protein
MSLSHQAQPADNMRRAASVRGMRRYCFRAHQNVLLDAVIGKIVWTHPQVSGEGVAVLSVLWEVYIMGRPHSIGIEEGL